MQPRTLLVTLFENIKRTLFAVLSRTGVAGYSCVPVFGFLRASVAVVRNGPLVVVIDRSDGRGLSFPGGLAWPWETSEEAMRRELLEETGLQIEKASPLFEYRTSADVPCILSVFDAETTGNLADSWEGSPLWLPLAEIQASLLPSQKEIVDRILAGPRSQS
ncbi:MAG: NUDIX hydrolase [Candidatus Sulfotelmatobacter sp.]